MTLIQSKVVLEPDQDEGLVPRLAPRLLQVHKTTLVSMGREVGNETYHM